MGHHGLDPVLAGALTLVALYAELPTDRLPERGALPSPSRFERRPRGRSFRGRRASPKLAAPAPRRTAGV